MEAFRPPPTSTGNCKRRRREAAIAECKKPLIRQGSVRERRKLPQRGLGRCPRNRPNFEHFHAKRSTFWELVNLILFKNQIEKIVSKPRTMKKFDRIIYTVCEETKISCVRTIRLAAASLKIAICLGLRCEPSAMFKQLN